MFHDLSDRGRLESTMETKKINSDRWDSKRFRKRKVISSRNNGVRNVNDKRGPTDEKEDYNVPDSLRQGLRKVMNLRKGRRPK